MIPGGGQFKANRGAKGRNCSKLLELDTATHIWGWIYSQHLELDKSAVSADGTAVPTDGTTMSTDNTALVSTDRIKKGEFYKEEAAPSTSNKPEMTRAERREIFKKLNLNLKSKKGLGKKDLFSSKHIEESMEALTRAERHEMRTQQYQKGQSEPKKVSVDETLINSNYVKEKMGITGFGDFKDHKLSKREQDKKDAKERYWKLHLAGKTHQAKFDLGRLAKIKVERQQAAAKRLAETEARNAEVEAKNLKAQTKAQTSGKRS